MLGDRARPMADGVLTNASLLLARQERHITALRSSSRVAVIPVGSGDMIMIAAFAVARFLVFPKPISSYGVEYF